MGLKAAIQALKEAEELKARICRHSDLLNNSEVWTDQQRLQTVYQQVLVLDLEYALDKKVEQELWTLGFKNYIAALQHLAKDKKNPRRSESQALLSWCLEAASGFYLTLLQELCSAFALDLPFRRRGAIYGQRKFCSSPEDLTQPQKSSCLYICQYCLVHLGDIARYRSQRKQAESFYRHAILLAPSSGQPYNQLALLEASRGDKLATVFHYVRSISVKHLFPAAATNLSNTLSTVIDSDLRLSEIQTKLSLSEFQTTFLRVHGLLSLASDLDQAELCVKSLNATFTALVATQAFSTAKLIQMTAINLYALHHSLDSFSKEQVSSDELRVKNLILDLLAGALSAYLLPIYTMTNNSTLLDYYALPAIKLTMDWIKIDPNILCDSVFTKRLQIWPSFCKLLNSLQQFTEDFYHEEYDNLPLPEDRDLQCFLPLENAFKHLDFTLENLKQDQKLFSKIRTFCLVNHGRWLAKQTVHNETLITAVKPINSTKIVFEPSNKQPDPTTELLEELKHFTVKETDEDSKRNIFKGAEKRGGILKPQGSLEKAREEREQASLLLNASASKESTSSSTVSLSNGSVTSVRSELGRIKRTRQNVALQTLAKKNDENKQVKFRTEPLVKTDIKPTLSVVEMVEPSPSGRIQPQVNQSNYNIRPALNVSNIPFQPFTANPSQSAFNINPNVPFAPYQPIATSSTARNDAFSPWQDNKPLPPMPPATWWTSQKPTLPTNRSYTQPEVFNSGYSPFANEASGFGAISSWPTASSSQTLFGQTQHSQPDLNPLSMHDSTFNMNQQQQTNSMPGYSLFNSNWAPNLALNSRSPPLMRQQSLFSGPGPSPLERLLEQQKQLRGKPDT